MAILPYDDKTGTANFEYMPSSLKEAITNSMHEKFEFNEVDAAKVTLTAEQVKKSAKGVFGPKEAAEVCRKTDVDILIFGSFTFDKAKNEIAIATNISLGSTDKFRTLPTVQNKVDSTIFGAADCVATDIVAEITRIAKEQQEAKGKAAEAEANKKTQLAKTEKRKTWTDINWNVGFFAGTHYALINRNNLNVRQTPTAAMQAMYLIRGNWHLGAYAGTSNYSAYPNNSPYNTIRSFNLLVRRSTSVEFVTHSFSHVRASIFSSFLLCRRALRQNTACSSMVGRCRVWGCVGLDRNFLGGSYGISEPNTACSP
ncbi:MAG: hypothetical protein N2Z22_02125 [Turneriella sp.]|nr:hypothetical protein [Turneriella sp.]